MNHVFKASCATLAILTSGAMAGWSVPNEPIVADFDSLATPNDGNWYWESYGDFSSHAGMLWTCPQAPINDYQASVYQSTGAETGYAYGITSGEQAFFSPWASPVEVSLEGGGLWTMNAVSVTSGWNNGMTFTFLGLRGGELVAEANVVNQYATVVELVTFGNAFIGIDTLVVSASGGTNAGFGGVGDHFAMDDFTYSIPAPGAIALLGVAGCCARRRRNA